MSEEHLSPTPDDNDVCPDAETLAAWVDRGLAPDERAQLEAHVAGCARCQTHLATMARMPSEESEPAVRGEWSRREKRLRHWRWLVPATGAVAAAGLWLLVQPRVPSPSVPPSPEQPRQVHVRPEPQRTAPTRRARDEERKAETLSKDTAARDAALGAATGAAAPSSPPPAAASAPRAVEESVTLQRAEVGNAVVVEPITVHRTGDGRVTWEARAGDISAQVTAGASPSASVIWLVGKGGLVLLSTDSRSWRRLPFPEAADLTGVEATSHTTATVTTADARAFTTTDGGLTWQRR